MMVSTMGFIRARSHPRMHARTQTSTHTENPQHAHILMHLNNKLQHNIHIGEIWL